MIRLSVNVNKIATLRNSRGGRVPSVLEAVAVCMEAGAHGITVHPRADCRHITPDDVREVGAALSARRKDVEFNIEGDPRPGWLSLVREICPDQCTLVPVVPGELTSHTGWTADSVTSDLPVVIRDLKSLGIRVSLFVDPVPSSVELAAAVGADRVELYTEPFARAFERSPGEGRLAFDAYVRSARLAHSLGLGVNAGHDLDLVNVSLFKQLPHLDEVSIGHALISRAVFRGLGVVVREYLEAVK
jgi:pyridoxine 5-phosphate synthase